MLSVKGTFQNGAARPVEPIVGHDGQWVIITFLSEDVSPIPKVEDEGWDMLAQLLAECAVETGIVDLAHQHDPYLYGKPKHENGHE